MANNMLSIQTPIGVATLIGKHPCGDRVLCMHTRTETVDNIKKRYTYSKWWAWDGEKITGEYDDTQRPDNGV